MKCSIKTTKGKIRMKNRTRNKEQGQQIENIKEYGIY